MNRASLFSLRRLTKLFYAMGVMMLVFGMLLSAVSMPVQARGMDPAKTYASVTPEYVDGNPSCPSGYTEIKFEADKNEYGTTKGPVSMSVTDDRVTWSSTVGIDIVYVKGGPGANKYSYNEALGDSDLVAPTNSKNNKPYGVSHVSFCYDGDTPEPPDNLSVSWECDSSTEAINWFVSNPNDFAISFTYTVSGGAVASGSDTVNAGAKFNFAKTNLSSSDEFMEVKWSYGSYGGTASATATVDAMKSCIKHTQTPPPTPEDLEVDWGCAAEDGFIRWTLENPNTETASYTYSLNGGAGVSGSVAGGDTITLTTSAVTTSDQSISVSWSIGSHSSSSGATASAADMADCELPDPDPDPLVVDWGCAAEDGFVRWTLENPNTETASYTYTLSGGASGTGTGTVDGGQTITLTTSAVSSSDQSMSVSWSIGTHSVTSSASASAGDMEACKADLLLPLQVSWACNEDEETIDWRIYNPNSEAVGFSYKLTIGTAVEENSLSANPGQTIFLNKVITTVDQEMVVTWNDGEEDQTDSDTATAGQMALCPQGPPPVPGLTLEYICGYEEEFNSVNYKWRVSNPDDEAVAFTWHVTGSTESGSDTIPAGGSVIFDTTFGKKTVEIWVDGEILVTQQTSGDPCLKYLDPVWSCNLQEGEGVDWSVKNPNSFQLGFGYALNTAPVQNDTIASLGDKFLLYSAVDPQTMKVNWETDIWGPRSVQESADVDSCQEDPTPTPTQPTPTQPTPTVPTPTDPPPTDPTPTNPSRQTTPIVPVTGSTPVPTMPAPEIVADPELIPVTGVDFSNAPFGIPALALLQGLLVNLGLGLLGIGLISQGLVGYLSKR